MSGKWVIIRRHATGFDVLCDEHGDDIVFGSKKEAEDLIMANEFVGFEAFELPPCVYF